MLHPPFQLEGYTRASAFFNEIHHIYRFWNSYRPPAPLKRSDFALLSTLDNLRLHGHSSLTVSQLARYMHQTPSAVSQKLVLPEKLGFVQRTQDANDRRIAHIALTPSGQSLCQQALQQFFAHIEHTLDALGPEKAETLLALLHELGNATNHPNTPDEQHKGECPTC